MLRRLGDKLWWIGWRVAGGWPRVKEYLSLGAPEAADRGL